MSPESAAPLSALSSQLSALQLSVSAESINLHLQRQKCRTSGDRVLPISEIPTPSSSSTSLSVSPNPKSLLHSQSPSLFSFNFFPFLFFSGTTADDLYPLFDKYGKVVDVFIPRDRRFPPLSLSLSRLIFFF